MRSNVRFAFALVMTCFFVSGVAGLVYQVAWARYLALFLGHTSYAIVAVLVAFMGGLAVGNAVLGAVADRASRPLALYGWLEIGIALYGLAFPWYYEICHELYLMAAGQVGGGGTPLLLLKFGFSFLTILAPTVMMGATFPALTRFVTHALSELRERVASLYFINSFGAVTGCFVADFWWIPSVGLEMTLFGAAGLNLLAGLVALGLSRAMVEGSTAEAVVVPARKDAPEEYFSALDLKIATIAIGCSGFVAMLYEVAWTRLLALALGSSTHAFSIMLITFISGIAVGAAIIARWKSLKRTMDAFGWSEMALAATVFVSMFVYELLPFWFVESASILDRRPDVFPFYELMQGLICFMVMFVPAVCLGMTLPLASRIATAEIARTGRSVGRIFAVNTLGTVLGAAVTGLFLMPTFGLARTFAIGFVLNAAIGAAIIWRSLLVRVHGVQVATALGAAAVIIWVAGAHFDPLWRASFTQGVWRTRANAGDLDSFRRTGALFRFKYYKDGAGSTVALHYYTNNPTYLSLRVNGKADASSGDVGTQLLLGHLPALLHTQATNALVVGLGSGMTSSALLRHTNMARVQVIEISPEVREAAVHFKDHNDNVLENPKLHIAIEDAKSFLKLTPHQYDIIVSEPSNPWMAGVASVFSLEYYQSCEQRLASNGVMIQWVQIYETSDEALQTVIKTFTAVFPFTSIWRSQRGDLILAGSIRPRAVNLEAMLARMTDPHVRQDLERGDFSEPLALLSREVVSPDFAPFVPRAETPVHSDFFPTLEYMSQVGFFVGGGATLVDQYDETKITRPGTLLAAYLKKYPLSEADFRRASSAHLDDEFVDSRLVYGLMVRWSQLNTNSTLPLEMIERLNINRTAAMAEELRLTPRHDWLLEQARSDIAALHFYERVLIRAYRAKRSVFLHPNTAHLESALKLLLERDPANQRVFNLHLAELAWDRGDDEACMRLGELALNPDSANSGRLQFALDEFAPRHVLFCMIEISLRTKGVLEARNLVHQARAGGYLARDENYHPLLELICRKVEVTYEAALAAASGRD